MWLFQVHFKKSIAIIQDLLEVEVPPYVMEYAELYKSLKPKLIKARKACPSEIGGNCNCTLVHGDPRPENFFFEPFTAIDFQFCKEGCGEGDIVWLIVNGFETEYRREHEMNVLYRYFNALFDLQINDHCFERVLY